MHTVTVFIPRDPATCWRAFVDVRRLTRWVPGLERADTLMTARGMPAEVHFEYRDAMAYTLVYRYDAESREVRWEPKLGPAEGVSGFARFDAEASGTRMTYGVEPGAARDASATQHEADLLVAAFAAFVTA